MFLFVSMFFNAAATTHKKQVFEKKSATHLFGLEKGHCPLMHTYIVPSFWFGRQVKMFILTMGE